MYFDMKLGAGEIPADAKVNYREAVRGIALNQDNKVLMVCNSKGDYKFPGGGIEAGEDHFAALDREFREETGYAISEETALAGIIVETRMDLYDPGAYFVMKSYYYSCQVTGGYAGQCLDAYEQELDFKPVYLTFEEACQTNQRLLDHQAEALNDWVERETAVLKILADCRKSGMGRRL